MSLIPPSPIGFIRSRRDNNPPPDELPQFNPPRNTQYEQHRSSQFQRTLQRYSALLPVVVSPLLGLDAERRVQQTELPEEGHLQLLQEPIRPGLSTSHDVQNTRNRTEPTTSMESPNDDDGEFCMTVPPSDHQRRVKKVLESLEPIVRPEGSDRCTILVCFGEDTPYTIFPVPVTTGANEMDCWTRIRQSWYQRRGFWRKYLPILRVVKVEKVKVRPWEST